MLTNTIKMKTMLTAVAALGLSLAAGRASATTTTVISGTACRARLDSVSLVDSNPFGIYSVNQTFGTAANISCPIPLPAGAYLQTVSVKAFDRNNGGTIIGTGWYCTLYYQNGSGTTYTGPSAGLTNTFSVPNVLGFSMTLDTNVWGAEMECQIPNQTSYGVSSLINYTITY